MQNEEINSCVYALIQLSGHSPKIVKYPNIKYWSYSEVRGIILTKQLYESMQKK